MTDAIERQILEGVPLESALASGSRTPPRTPSPSTSDELGSDLDDDQRQSRRKDADGAIQSHSEVPIDRPGANTGPKGVRADARAAEGAARKVRDGAVQERSARIESGALNSQLTSHEEDALRRQEAAIGGKVTTATSGAREAEAQELENLRAARIAELRRAQKVADERRKRRLAGEDEDVEALAENLAELQSDATGPALVVPQSGLGGLPRKPASRRTGFFGHLREVDQDGYADAIDREGPTTSVVVHLYEKGVPACAILTASLASLARLHPHTKFLQACASAIGFGSGRTDSTQEEDEDEEDFAERIGNAIDLSPTLLIYRAGAVVANLVRLDLDSDWNGGEEKAVRDILLKHAAISA
ncbi:Conserved phosducin-like protein [Ceraceosorus bombacis]|uniref:Conserved phosducin-like protein n=1 Tax=Ceraceosorus bombacis TaxID=401625 RepID=A0A0P1BP70_9BASI|nr:Conserved phosducin-like protein [Ceraceosorus bombacis]